MSIANAKLPASVVTGAIGMMVGLGGGILLASYVDLGVNKQAQANTEGKAPDVPAMGEGGKGGGKGGMGGGMGMGGGKGGGG
jgi:hypothetical protein